MCYAVGIRRLSIGIKKIGYTDKPDTEPSYGKNTLHSVKHDIPPPFYTELDMKSNSKPVECANPKMSFYLIRKSFLFKSNYTS